VAVSHQVGACPSGSGLQCSTWSCSSAGPVGQESEGQGSSHPMHSWGTAGPEGRWTWWGMDISEICGTGSGLGSSADAWRGSRWSWIQCHSQKEGIRMWCGSRGWRPMWLRGWYPSGEWIPQSPKGGDPTKHGSGAGLWPRAARGAESLAEWSSGFAGLWGRDLAGQLFFY
jgi:hypothetical protein